MKLSQPPILRILISSVALLLIGLLFARFVSSASGTNAAQSDAPPIYRAEKINLALRRTAHHLLRLSGDSTSRIPAIEQSNPHTFRVSFSRAFNYDSLPALLHQSFQLHNVTDSYDVAVLDCARGELQLGYNKQDLLGNEPIPCGGRFLTAGCYVLQVTFELPASTLR